MVVHEDVLSALVRSIENLDRRLRVQSNKELALQSWQSVSLLNSWADVGAPYPTPGYWKSPHGVVYLRGTIDTGTAPSVAFVLPENYKPNGTLQFSVPSSGVISVEENGDVTVASGTTVSLDGVHFRAYV